MRHTKLLVLGICLLVPAIGQAQFFTSCTRQKNSRVQVKEALERAEENAKLPWVTLVEEEIRRIKKDRSRYGLKTPTFTQSSPTDARAFTVRKMSVVRGLNTNAVLRGYDLVIAQPKDITSLREWEVDYLSMFFRQGITFGTSHGDFRADARKFQDGVVELRLKPRESEHTFLLLVNCRRHTVYLFVDRYKNRVKDS